VPRLLHDAGIIVSTFVSFRAGPGAIVPDETGAAPPRSISAPRARPRRPEGRPGRGTNRARRRLCWFCRSLRPGRKLVFSFVY